MTANEIRRTIRRCTAVLVLVYGAIMTINGFRQGHIALLFLIGALLYLARSYVRQLRTASDVTPIDP